MKKLTYPHALAGVAIAAALVLGNLPALAQLTTNTETFNSNLGQFTLQVRNKTNGNELNWQDLNNAGGTAGELGGFLARTRTADAAYVGAPLNGALTPATQDIVLSGKLYLGNINFDGNLFIGYANTNGLDTLLGLQIAEPGGGFEPNYRLDVRGPGSASGTLSLPGYTPLTFQLVWSPTTARLTGTVGAHVIDLGGAGGSIAYDAVIVGAFGAGSSERALQTEIFVDDLTYSALVPPPLVVALTNPPSGSSAFAGDSVTLAADAQANAGVLTKVEFYAQPTNEAASKLGESVSAPYNYVWNSVPAGSYTLTAVAFNSLGNSATSAPVLFTATTQPTATVTLISPRNPNGTDGAFVVAAGVYHPRGGTNTPVPVVTVSATNTVNAGAITNVSFFTQVGGNTITKIGEATTEPFTLEWTNPPAGHYLLTARARSDAGAFATSAPVHFYVLVPRPTILVTNDFSGGPGRWTDTVGNNSAGTAFHWTNSQTAGGGAATGEMFSLLAGASFAEQKWVGDNHLNGWLQPSFQNLTFRGRVSLENINFSDIFVLGFQNTRRPGDILGIAQGLTGDPNPAGFPAIVGSFAASSIFTMPATSSIPFELQWNCTNNTITGFVGATVLNHTDSPSMPFGRAFDAVSVITTWGSVNPSRQCKVWLDDVSYSLVAAPTLHISHTGGQIEVRWQGVGYVLQSSSDLGSGVWLDDPGPPVQSGDTFTVTFTPVTSPAFFRLVW